jgi:uncharacterized delta-60 repeat protein
MVSLFRVLGQWGGVDTTFSASSGFDNDVFSIGVRPDGKLLVTGFFESHGRTSRSGVARLLSGGDLDSGFDPGNGATTPGGLPHTVDTHTLLPDGRVMVGGRFQAFDGVTQPYLARLNENGSFDNTYRPALDGLVVAMALQADGGLLIGGSFQTISGSPRNRLARLLSSGSPDPAFATEVGPDRSISAIAIQPDGRILVAGAFTNYSGTPRFRIARLSADGQLDTNFNLGNGPNRAVQSISLQPDGKIIIGGEFTEVDGVPRNYVARLNEDGSPDASFTPDFGLVFGGVLVVRVATDGKVLVGGEFTTVDGEARLNLVRLGSDGRLDPTFDIGNGPSGGFEPRVRTIAFQPDGKVLVGGGFTRFDGANANYIVRLTANQGASVQFTSSTYTVNEDASVAQLELERIGSTNGWLWVNYATGGGTATPGTDYMPTSGAVSFPPGVARQFIEFNVQADAEVEGDETVGVTLANPVGGATLGNPLTALVTILDRTNAAPPLIIRSITLSGAGATITWDSAASLAYRVEFKTNLTQSAWDSLEGDVVATGPTATKVDALIPDPARYYRVRRLP